MQLTMQIPDTPLPVVQTQEKTEESKVAEDVPQQLSEATAQQTQSEEVKTV